MHSKAKPLAPERRKPEQDEDELAELSRMAPDQLLARLETAAGGLTAAQAARRLKVFGPNLISRERTPTIVEELWQRAKNPLNAKSEAKRS